MGHIRLGLTYFESEEDFQRIVEERERTLATMPTVEQP